MRYMLRLSRGYNFLHDRSPATAKSEYSRICGWIVAARSRGGIYGYVLAADTMAEKQKKCKNLPFVALLYLITGLIIT